jgi:perosamine synthetase
VIVPAISFLATANCARYLGAEPVFADVDPDTGLVLTEEIERRLSAKSRAVIPVHLNGALADMSAVCALADRPGTIVVCDSAHSLGAAAADCGGMAVYSFHPVKAVTTGEGGAVTTDDPELLRRLRLFRNHGIERDPERFRFESPGPWYHEQQVLGFNLRMTDLQAALGVSQLTRLERFVTRRRALAARYDRLLESVPGVTPVVPRARRAGCAYHLYAVLIEFEELGVRRADVMRRLRERGIGTQVHFIPIPAQPYYRDRGWNPDEFPGARRYYERQLSLPMFPAMRDADPDRVVTSLAELLRA